jgi:hypothetical protein
MYMADTSGHEYDDGIVLAVAKFNFNTSECEEDFRSRHIEVELLHLACTTDGYVLVVYRLGDPWRDETVPVVAIHDPHDLRQCAALFVDAARAACGTQELTCVLTPSALHIFRVGARAASVIVDAADAEFAHVAVKDGTRPQFVVWAQTRGAHHGHARVYTPAGALVHTIDTATLPNAPVGMAASRHGELAFLCVINRAAYIALVDVFSGEARVCEAPEALPGNLSQTAGIAFAPTGVVCCASGGYKLFR